MGMKILAKNEDQQVGGGLGGKGEGGGKRERKSVCEIVAVGKGAR
jgi:hypothetical protein